MKNTKLALKLWVENPLPTPTSIRIDRVSDLASIQFELEDKVISTSHLALEKSAQLIASQSFRLEEENLRLKSRCLWLNSRDKNTAFFHRQCRVRLSKNHISEISAGDGDSIKGHDLLKHYTRTHFQLLFQDDGLINKEVTFEYLDNIPSLVNEEDNLALMNPFSEQEIVEVI